MHLSGAHCWPRYWAVFPPVCSQITVTWTCSTNEGGMKKPALKLDSGISGVSSPEHLKTHQSAVHIFHHLLSSHRQVHTKTTFSVNFLQHPPVQPAHQPVDHVNLNLVYFQTELLTKIQFTFHCHCFDLIQNQYLKVKDHLLHCMLNKIPRRITGRVINKPEDL